ncbi:TPA: hypothetical protein UL242_002347 [Clostridioides difficile]|nr:hypothetical protein [Clostridioides difficile]MBH7166026.1 hypothetical protein [Clostridioides difficile]MBH7845740.1 hypothetical protein [Clostridioides difficile]MBY1346608.1 hypothetical protein [Clostridioides difficile]MBY1661652.1 hypothetical protein [Clostridioides difficile]MCW0773210.1 hypothetical protein [Clostridioides difficile]
MGLNSELYNKYIFKLKENGYNLKDIKWDELNLSNEEAYNLYLEAVSSSQ